MQVFGNIVLNPDTDYNRHVNFQSFVSAILVLFRCATGEAWPNIMLACAEGRQCDPGALKRNDTTGVLLEPGKLCGSNFTYAYFVSFIFLCSFLMLNLFVAVIMDNFDYLTRDSSILGAHHLDEFIRIWAEYDPSATGLIHYAEMYDMLKNMDPPLGFGSKCPDRLAYKKLIRMNMPLDSEGKVHFTTTLFALIRENLSIKMRSAEEMDQADVELRETILKVWSFAARSKIDLLVPRTSEIGRGRLTVGKIYGGLLILENWKTSRFGARLPPPGAKGRGQMMVRGHWEGNRYVGDLDRHQHQLDQDFLELRATTNPYHRAAQSQDRRVGQHFPLATRRIGPSVSRSPSPSQTRDDHYTEWVPQPHGSWNQSSWQDPQQLAPPPDSDAQCLQDTAPLEAVH